MNVNELSEIIGLIKKAKLEVIDIVEGMKIEYLHALEMQRTIVFETFIYERLRIKLGCLVSYRGRKYYVTNFHEPLYNFPADVGTYIATLKEKCYKNYKDKRKWYSGEDKTLHVDARLLTLIEEDKETRKLVIKVEQEDMIADLLRQSQHI